MRAIYFCENRSDWERVYCRSKKRHIRGVFDRRRIVRKSRFGGNRFFRNFKGNYGAKVGILGDGSDWRRSHKKAERNEA